MKILLLLLLLGTIMLLAYFGDPLPEDAAGNRYIKLTGNDAKPRKRARRFLTGSPSRA